MESEIYPHAPVSESGTIRKIKSKVPASFLFKHKRNLHLFCSNTDVTRFESRYRILKFLRHHENLKSAKNPYDTRVFSLCHPASFLFNYAKQKRNSPSGCFFFCRVTATRSTQRRARSSTTADIFIWRLQGKRH